MDQQRKPGRPRKTQQQIDTTNEHIGQVGQTAIKTDAPIGEAVHRSESDIIDVVSGPDAMTKAGKLAFMEEFVEVMVMETTDKTQEPVPGVGVNGRMQFFVRGRPQRVRRKYVDVLAGCKHTSYAQSNDIDSVTGNVRQIMNPMTSLKYPFSVIRDDNPKGAAWLRERLASAR